MPRLDRKDAVYVAILVALVLLFFNKFLIRDLIPINADWLHANFQPGLAYYPGLTARNIELDDPVYQFYPLRLEAVRQWKSGIIPLWNPGILCGSPLLADGISKPLDPLIMLWFALDGPTAHSLELLAQFMLMATGMYFLARRLGLAHAGAAVSSVVYTFNLLSVTWMELRTPAGAFAFFPWAFLFLVCALENRSFGWAALSGLCAAFMELAGHPQFVLYGFAVLGAFVIWRTAGARHESARAAAKAFACGCFALLLGIALSAVETVPFLELVKNSSRNARQYELSNLWCTPLSFITYLYPNFFGNPARGGYLGGGVLIRPYMTATAGFVGGATLVFVVAGLFLAKVKDKRFFAFLAFGVPLVLLAAGAGLGQTLSNFTTFFSAMDASRLVFISNLALAVLAGAGAAGLADADWKTAAHRYLVLAVIVLVLIVVLATASLSMIGPYLALMDKDQAQSISWFVREVEQRVGNVLFWPGVYTRLHYVAIAVGLILVAPLARRVSPPMALLLVAYELIRVGIGYNPFVPAALIAPDFPPLSVVKRAPGESRVLGVDSPDGGDLVAIKGDWLVPNTATLYGLEDVRGDESLRLDRYQKYIIRIVGSGVNLAGSIHMPFIESPLIDALNVRYIFSSAPLYSRNLRKLFGDGRAFVYENTRALPRAHLVGRWRAAGSNVIALTSMQSDADFHPSTDVVLEAAVATLPDMPESFPGGTAAIVEYSASRVRVKTDCATASMLVLADSYYPGWLARVDGQPAPVMPANGALRAVSLSPGAHSVEFAYQPASFRLGAWISIVAGAVTIVAFAVSLRRKPAVPPKPGLVNVE